MTFQKHGTLFVKRQPRTLHTNLAEAGKKAGLQTITPAPHGITWSQLKHLWADSKEAIAMVLRHASTGTQKRYGSRRQGGKLPASEGCCGTKRLSDAKPQNFLQAFRTAGL